MWPPTWPKGRGRSCVGETYDLRDIDGALVTSDEAKVITAQRYTVTNPIRQRAEATEGKPFNAVPEGWLRSHAQGVVRTRRPSPSTGTEEPRPMFC